MSLFVALLAVAFLGPLLGSRGHRSAWGLAPAALLAGFLLGPLGLGVFEARLIVMFRPILGAASGWLGFLAGMAVGLAFRAQVRAFLVGVAGSLVVAGLLALAVYGVFLLPGYGRHATLPVLAFLPFCLGLNAFLRTPREGAPTAPYKILAPAQAVVTTVAFVGMWTLTQPSAVAGASWPSRLGIFLLLGTGLGTLLALLLGREFRRDESWGLLLGTVLFAAGSAEVLGLPPLGVTLLLGTTVAVASEHRLEIAHLVANSERTVWLPFVLVLGAEVPFSKSLLVWAPALGCLVVWHLSAPLWRWFRPREHKRAGSYEPPLWLAARSFPLFAAGEAALRNPGRVGETLLLGAVLATFLGDLSRALTGVSSAPTEPAPLARANTQETAP